MGLVSPCRLETTVSFKEVRSNGKHVVLNCEDLKHCSDRNNAEAFPFVNILAKATPLTSRPALTTSWDNS